VSPISAGQSVEVQALLYSTAGRPETADAVSGIDFQSECAFRGFKHTFTLKASFSHLPGAVSKKLARTFHPKLTGCAWQQHERRSKSCFCENTDRERIRLSVFILKTTIKEKRL
jgi:hypothetical protein